MPWFGIVSYAAAALSYGLIGAILLVNHSGGRRTAMLAAATITSSLWAVGIASMLLWWGDRPPLFALVGLDAIHLFVWTLCVLSWIASRFIGRWTTALSAIATMWVLLAASSFPADSQIAQSVYPTLLFMALAGFLAVERVFRSAKDDQRKRLLLLSLAAGGIFVIDLFVYSQASLIGRLAPGFWEARGIVNAALGPLVVFAIRRAAEWDRDLFVSRQVALYTASLLGVGGYLLTMGLAAYVIRAFGGEWSLLLEVLFLLAALVLFAFVLFSSGIRTQIRAFLIKHFYRHKYDYRREWLQLTQSLGSTGELKSLVQNGLEGLARIVGSERGDLWLDRGTRQFEWMIALDGRVPEKQPYEISHPIVAFLAANGWVIDSQEYAREPGKYGSSFGHPNEQRLPPDSLIVPLDCQGVLQGFVVLGKPAGVKSLNFEDHDILKTAGRQVGVVLGQALALEKLTETRQFEAMNKLSTFLMHDLKNIVAQQDLVVVNAQRFRHRTEFFDDAVATIRSGVERMKRLLEQLQSVRSLDAPGGRVDVSKLLMEVRSHCADREPVPQIELSSPAMFARLDREKLTSALTHLVRNAQDATPSDGEIRISVTNGDGQLSIAVTDTGCGMDAAFIRNRLFKPFDTTKGVKGMGIGAYQVRELVRSTGGDVHVSSRPGQGTAFTLRIPSSGG